MAPSDNPASVPDAFASNTEHKPGEPPPEVKRDQWGRYLLPHPDTGKLQGWTRSTTFAKSVADQYNIDLYHQRLVAKGVAMRPDLYAEAAGLHIDQKKDLQRVATLAMEAAGSSAKARLGTALHTFTEKRDRGEKFDVPAPWDTDVAAYAKKLTEEKIKVRREYIETVVLVPKFGVAGTLDRIVGHESWELDRIGDLKTGHSVEYAWMEIACQLFLYAHATHWYDVKTETLYEMPEIDKTRALVIHLPVGDAQCDLYEINLELGNRVAMASEAVRGLRKRKDFSVPWEGSVTQAVGKTAEAAAAEPSDDWDDDTPAEAVTTTESAADDDVQVEVDEWGDPIIPPPAKAKKKAGRPTAEVENARAAEKILGDRNLPDLPQEWLDAGIDPTKAKRYQRTKLANKKYIAVDIETGAHEVFPLLRDCKARVDELDDSLLSGASVHPLGAPKDSPAPAPVVSEDEWDEKVGDEWDAEAAGPPPKPETATVTPEDAKAPAGGDDEWADEASESDEKTAEASASAREKAPKAADDEVARLRAEIDKIRSEHGDSMGGHAAPATKAAEPAPKAEKKSEPKKKDWMAQVMQAPDDEALNAVWRAAKAANQWNDRLNRAAGVRRAEIAAEAANKAAEDDDDDWD